MTFCAERGSQVQDSAKFCGSCGKPMQMVNAVPSCTKCGVQLPQDVKFCPSCGSAVVAATRADLKISQPKGLASSTPTPTVNVVISQDKNTKSAAEKENDEEEIEYYRGTGELIIKRTEHRGAARKVMGVAAGFATFGVGYAFIGKDKTRKSKADGLIVITNRAIYVAGNDYPFDRIISLTKQGTISKSIVITFEKDVRAGGRDAGSVAGTGGLSIEAEMKTKDIDQLFIGLEQAKLSKIKRRAL